MVVLLPDISCVLCVVALQVTRCGMVGTVWACSQHASATSAAASPVIALGVAFVATFEVDLLDLRSRAIGLFRDRAMVLPMMMASAEAVGHPEGACVKLSMRPFRLAQCTAFLGLECWAKHPGLQLVGGEVHESRRGRRVLLVPCVPLAVALRGFPVLQCQQLSFPLAVSTVAATCGIVDGCLDVLRAMVGHTRDAYLYVVLVVGRGNGPPET